MVGMARLELATPRSQSECATNCATSRRIYWGEQWGSNPRPSEPQSDALPTELYSPNNFMINYFLIYDKKKIIKK